MTTLTSTISLLAVLGLTAACAADDAAETIETSNTGGSTSTAATSTASSSGGMGGSAGDGSGEFPPCGTGENSDCVPSGFPFASLAFPHSNSCEGTCTPEPTPWGHPPPEGTTISMTQPESGTLCLTGENPLEHTAFYLSFSVERALENGDLEILKIFNADLLGVTQMRFAIDNPPSAGVYVLVSTITKPVCDGIGCGIWGFEPPEPLTESGRVTLAFDDFAHEQDFEFDTRAIGGMSFDVAPGAFDFCISDFEFLDAEGNVVPER